jgi:hypothetical protein
VPEAIAVRAELYKLNLMTEGGFFKSHKDTPRGGDSCFGTLVVALPVPFTGWLSQQERAEKPQACTMSLWRIPMHVMMCACDDAVRPVQAAALFAKSVGWGRLCCSACVVIHRWRPQT